MNKFKLFIENFIVYGLGGTLNKLIPLIMIPIITRLMPEPSYFGISDLLNTVIQFGSAFAVMGMYDAMYRMFFEQDLEAYRKQVCSTAFIFTLSSSFIVFLFMIATRNWMARYFLGDKRYGYLIYFASISMLFGATNSIVSAPTRMQNKRNIFLITNFVSPMMAYSIAFILLIQGHYLIALPVASMISSGVIELIFLLLNKRWFTVRDFDFKLLKELLLIAIPIFPNFMIYWIFNSCDKVMITNMLGVQEAGIYSVGSKFGHMSQLIYTAFAGGWQYFAFSTMKEENQVKSNSMVFEYLGIISFVATLFICAWCHPIFTFLFTGDYAKGYVVVPYLFLAPLLQMLFQVASNQFLIIKKTWPNILILSSGAICNIFTNSLLIPQLGIEGAAIATILGYIVSDLVCIIVLYKSKLMKISSRFLVSILFVMFYFIIWRLFIWESVILSTICSVALTCFIVILYRKDILEMLKSLKKDNI